MSYGVAALKWSAGAIRAESDRLILVCVSCLGLAGFLGARRHRYRTGPTPSPFIAVVATSRTPRSGRKNGFAGIHVRKATLPVRNASLTACAFIRLGSTRPNLPSAPFAAGVHKRRASDIINLGETSRRWPSAIKASVVPQSRANRPPEETHRSHPSDEHILEKWTVSAR